MAGGQRTRNTKGKIGQDEAKERLADIERAAIAEADAEIQKTNATIEKMIEEGRLDIFGGAGPEVITRVVAATGRQCHAAASRAEIEIRHVVAQRTSLIAQERASITNRINAIMANRARTPRR